ncbi:TPA: hypothetical protein DCW61_01015 [Candidatus Uhrbacteria bacterium]|nr:hypothetical protein [Candidatus Uhrbacteria bacterium]
MKIPWFTRITCLAVMSLLSAVSLFGCGTERPTTLPFTTNPTATTANTTEATTIDSECVFTEVVLLLREPRRSGFLPETDYLTCKEDGVEYHFDEDIAADTRETFIQSHQALISYLQDHQIFLLQSTRHIVLEDYASRSDSSNRKAFYAVEDTGTYMQILIALQSHFGDFTNYGLLYGISNYIAEELGWGIDITDVAEQDIVAFTEVTENQVFLDLSYPCFVSSYVGEALPMIQAVAGQFVRDLIDREGIAYAVDALRRENISPTMFLIEANDLKNDWLASIGSETRLTARELPIRFQYGGTTSPIIVSADHAKYYLMNDYAEVDLDVMGIDYFKSDYAHLIEAFYRIELDMQAADLVYKDPARTYQPLTVVLCNEEVAQSAANSIAYYSIPTTTAYSASVWPVNHEYLHYLSTPAVGYNWQYEAIACYGNIHAYFMRLYNQNFFDMMLAYGWEGLAELREHLGRDPGADDFPIYCEIYIAMTGDNAVTALSANALYSVPHYVRIIYGEEVMNRIFIHQNAIEAETGRSWQELIEDWQQWIIDTYGYLGS